MLIIVWTLPFSAAAQNAEQKRLNVLFIAIDDLNTAVGAYGHPLVKTPHIDGLAEQGVLFSRAYCQSPICIPSRASMLTGMRPETTQTYRSPHQFRDALPNALTLPQQFQQHDYFVARVGKIFHMGVPQDIGTGKKDDAPSWQVALNPKGRDVTEEDKLTLLTPDEGLGGSLSYLAAEGTDKEQTDGMVATEAIRLLTEHRNEPFFIAAGFFRPHPPFVAPKKYFDLYSLDQIQLPQYPSDDRKDIPDPALLVNPPNFGLSEQQQKEAIRAYYASVSFVDAQVGRLLRALDSLQLTDNTVVVVWSDHGWMLGEHGLWRKHTLFEEAARAPLIVAAPGKQKNMVAQQLVEFVDIYPTLAELCGVPSPPDLEGTSFVPLLDNPQQPWKQAAFTSVMTQDRRLGKSVRTDRWRYTEWDDGKAGEELYDHQKDSQEIHNRANDPEYASFKETVKQILHAGWQPVRQALTSQK